MTPEERFRLRVEFAKAALEGMIASGARIDDAPEAGPSGARTDGRRRRVAKDAWAMADAMIAESRGNDA